VRHACELVGAWDGGIGLYDPQRDVIRMEATHNMPADELGSEFKAGAGLAGQVLAARGVVAFQSYRQVPSATRRDRNEFAVLGVPIAWRSRLIGFFGLGAPMPRQFDAVDAEVLQLFGRHVAIAIQNARRYRQEQQRARRWAMVARVGRMAASGSELKPLLADAAQEIHESLGYPNTAIALIEADDPSQLAIESFGGRYRELLAGTVHRQPVSQGVMGAAVRERRVQRVDDVRADPRYVPPPGVGGEGIRAELAMPILLGPDVLGVLNVESQTPFTDDDVTSLRVVADHLALAVQNARLFERMKRFAADVPPSGVGLVTRLSELVEEIGSDALPIQLHIADDAPLPAPHADALQQIAREALRNVAQHSQATGAAVHLRRDARFVYLEVLDDGVGWPHPSAPRPAGGQGLRKIRRWAGHLGGQVDEVNRQPRGAAVRVVIPAPPRA
ncbi:MAG: GAF domain-containing protein, partial [Acidobacteriota bacterium]